MKRIAGDAANLAVVDGLKLMYADADIALDNTNAEVSFSGAWSTASSSTNKFKSDYRFATSGNVITAIATYRPDFPNAGLYDVAVWHPDGANRTTNAPWTISFFGGSTNVFVNQQGNGGFWFPLATACPFTAGTNGFVSVANNAAPVGNVVLADGVKFSFAGPLTPVMMSSIARPATGLVNLTVNSTPGYGVWIERTTNFISWLALTNLLNTNGTVNFTDTTTSNSPAGFYRARQ